MLDKKLHARPTDIAVAAISLLKFEPSLQKQLKSIRSGELIHNPLEIISDLDQLPLLRKLMSVCPLPDLELEKLFKKLRASILENFTSLKKASPELLRFQSALALQCFTNEYVYSQSQNEEKAINVLEKQIKELLIEQIEKPVRWRESVENMIGLGVNKFIEVGPGKVLSGLIKRIDRNVILNQVNNLEDVKNITND